MQEGEYYLDYRCLEKLESVVVVNKVRDVGFKQRCLFMIYVVKYGIIEWVIEGILMVSDR